MMAYATMRAKETSMPYVCMLDRRSGWAQHMARGVSSARATLPRELPPALALSRAVPPLDESEDVSQLSRRYSPAAGGARRRRKYTGPVG